MPTVIAMHDRSLCFCVCCLLLDELFEAYVGGCLCALVAKVSINECLVASNRVGLSLHNKRDGMRKSEQAEM